MHVALPLLDAQHDALQVLILRLDILLRAGDKDFAGLQDIAGFVFIRDAERNDVQFQEILHEILRSAHVEHFQEALFGDVDAVLRPSLPLGDPDGTLPGSDGLSDVLGQDLRGQVEFTGRDAADNLDHPVGPDQALDRLALEEVVAHADFGKGHLVLMQDQLREGGIQNDIPVVGHRQILAFYGLQLVQSVIGEVPDRFFDDPFGGLGHHLALEVIHGMNAQKDVPEIGFGLVIEDVLGNPGYVGVFSQF